MLTLWSVAWTATMRHCLAGAYQNTFGSRNSDEPMSRTVPYLVNVRPPSVL